MTTSHKVRWMVLALSVLIGVGLLFFLSETGRFYCAVSVIGGILFYYLTEGLLDRLIYGEKLALALKEGAATLKESEKLLHKAEKGLAGEIKTTIAQKQEALKAALKNHELAHIRAAGEELTKLVDKHLSANKKAAWRDIFDPIAIAVLLALLLRGFVLEACEIPSGSMIPTLYVGDKIFVNKLVYNVRIPFFNHSLFKIGEPKRGDVAVFVYPHNPSDNFVKRVVALPGDTVEVKSDFVYVNGKALSRRNIGSARISWAIAGTKINTAPLKNATMKPFIR